MDLTPEHVESRKSMLDSDPPGHTRLRASSTRPSRQRPSTPTRIESRRSSAMSSTEALAEPELDFVDAVAVELPMRILCELMGVPLEDRRYLVELGNRMLGNTDPGHGRRVRGRPGRPLAVRAPALLEPGGAGDVRVRERLGRRAPPRAARRPDDEADPGRSGRRPALGARVRPLLPPARHRRERDDAPCDVERAAGAPRAPGGARPAASPTRLSSRRPSRRSSAGRPRSSTSAARRPATSSCTARADPGGRQGRALVRLGQSGRARTSPTPFRFDVGRDAEQAPRLRAGRAALLPRRAPRTPRAPVWLEELMPDPGPARARRPARAAALELLPRDQEPADSGSVARRRRPRRQTTTEATASTSVPAASPMETASTPLDPSVGSPTRKEPAGNTVFPP